MQWGGRWGRFWAPFALKFDSTHKHPTTAHMENEMEKKKKKEYIPVFNYCLGQLNEMF